MQELTLETMLAVFEQMLGPVLFWGLLVICIVVTVTYLYVLVRDRAISMHKFLWAQLSMPIGAIAAIWMVMFATDSSFNDIGGPVDLMVVLVIALLGAVGCAILVYTVQSLLKQPIQTKSDG